MDDIREKLIKEYIQKYKYCYYWPMKLSGFSRFDIVNGKITKLTLTSLIYNMLILFLANSAVSYLVYVSVVTASYLKIPDGICALHFATFANLTIFSMSFLNRDSGLILIDHCIKIDMYIGVKTTSILREVGNRTLCALNILVTVTNVMVGIFLYNIYDVPMNIHFIGSLFFLWLFFSYGDYCFYVFLTTFMTLRVKFLNISLMRIANMNYNYVPDRSLFNVLFWNKKFDKLVKFENKSVVEYVKTFRLLFNLLRLLERFYKFPISLGVWTIVVGTFVSVQTFILRVKYSMSMENEKTFMIVGWALLSWGFMFIVTILVDMFQQQIEQTKLICAYTMLKRNLSADSYKLAKSILQTLTLKEPRPLMYNMYYIDTGFIFRMAASTLVYITVQLQTAFPEMSLDSSSSMKVNGTNTTYS